MQLTIRECGLCHLSFAFETVMKSKPAKFSAIIPQELDEKLKAIAASKGISFSDVIRSFLEQGVQREQQLEKLSPGCKESITLYLDPIISLLLHQTSLYSRISQEDVVNRMMLQHLPSEHQKAKEAAEQLESLVLPFTEKKAKKNNHETGKS